MHVLRQHTCEAVKGQRGMFAKAPAVQHVIGCQHASLDTHTHTHTRGAKK